MPLHRPVYVQPVAGDSNFPNGIPFTAQELRRNMQALLAAANPVTQSGVTVLDGQYAVTQHAAGANFSVDVAAGHAFVAGTDIANQSVYGCWNDGTVNVPTPTAPASGTEVHRLVLQVEDRYSNGVWTGYTANLNLLADTGSGTPAQPASAITLALVSVSAGQASVLNANITDQRPMLGVPDTWHPMTLLNGWTVGSGGIARYKLGSDNDVLVQLNNVTPGTIADATPIWTAPPGYVPVTEQKLPLLPVYTAAPVYGSSPFLYASGTPSLEVFNLRGTVATIQATTYYALD